jgi:hypothetical protein
MNYLSYVHEADQRFRDNVHNFVHGTFHITWLDAEPNPITKGSVRIHKNKLRSPDAGAFINTLLSNIY